MKDDEEIDVEIYEGQPQVMAPETDADGNQDDGSDPEDETFEDEEDSVA